MTPGKTLAHLAIDLFRRGKPSAACDAFDAYLSCAGGLGLLPTVVYGLSAAQADRVDVARWCRDNARASIEDGGGSREVRALLLQLDRCLEQPTQPASSLLAIRLREAQP